ncbi:MAG TPA: hypothetical protein EYF98_04415 [Planctomycetes bacterium]|nr:hypothetical protein [Planctomycetota bacterium]
MRALTPPALRSHNASGIPEFSRSPKTGHASPTSALDLSEASQFVTGCVEFSGLTPIVIGHENIEWHMHVGYRSFFEETADPLGFGDFVELGGGLDFAALRLSKVSFKGSVLAGHDVSGWTLGLSASSCDAPTKVNKPPWAHPRRLLPAVRAVLYWFPGRSLARAPVTGRSVSHCLPLRWPLRT